MKLMEAIVDANHRALAGDPEAGLHPTEYAGSLPIVALSCIDVRLNALLPQVLGVPAEQFIWLRNAGNIITGPVSSTMRSLALACAVKGGREIVVIGHTDCAVGRMTTMELIERFRALGIDRQSLPDNLNDYFGIFSSERSNVIKGVDLVRASPLISPWMAVHGLLVDIETGKIEWLVDGYQALGRAAPRAIDPSSPLAKGLEATEALGGFRMGEMNFPSDPIGDVAAQRKPAAPPGMPAAVGSAQHMNIVEPAGEELPPGAPKPRLPLPPRIPTPPPLKRRIPFRR